MAWDEISTDDRKRYKKAYNDRKRKFLNDIKIKKGCYRCGYAEHPAALDFDHCKGAKKFNVGSVSLIGWETLKREIKKCKVLCANCHRVLTHKRRSRR